MQSVTRVEIATHLAPLFTGELVTRDEVLAAAVQSGARADERWLATLERLPDQPFVELRDLWPALPEVAIERTGVR